MSQALEAAQWIRFTSAAADLTIYAGDLNTEPSDVPYLLLRQRAGLADSWLEQPGGGKGEGLTCNTDYNSYSDGTGEDLREKVNLDLMKPLAALQEVRGLTTSSTRLEPRLECQ